MDDRSAVDMMRAIDLTWLFVCCFFLDYHRFWNLPIMPPPTNDAADDKKDDKPAFLKSSKTLPSFRDMMMR